MTRKELVRATLDQLENEVKISIKDAEAFEKAMECVIENTLASGEKISLVGFGTFETTERKPRIGRNPKTNEEIQIPGGMSPKLKFSKSVKDAVKGE